MGNRDAAPDARGAEVLTTFQHLEKHALVFFVQAEQADEFLQHVVFGGAFEIELDGVFGEKLSQFHAVPSGDSDVRSQTLARFRLEGTS